MIRFANALENDLFNNVEREALKILICRSMEQANKDGIDLNRSGDYQALRFAWGERGLPVEELPVDTQFNTYSLQCAEIIFLKRALLNFLDNIKEKYERANRIPELEEAIAEFSTEENSIIRNWVRRFADIFYKNQLKKVLYEFQHWHSRYYVLTDLHKLEIMPREVAQAASAILIIYKEFLLSREGHAIEVDNEFVRASYAELLSEMTEYDAFLRLFEYFFCAEHYLKARNIFLLFKQVRDIFERFYEKKGLSYKSSWNKLVAHDLGNRMLRLPDYQQGNFSRVYNHTSVSEVFFPQKLRLLIKNSIDTVRQVEKKTGDLFVIQKFFQYELLRYCQEQFFDDAIFFDALFSCMKAAYVVNHRGNARTHLAKLGSILFSELDFHTYERRINAVFPLEMQEVMSRGAIDETNKMEDFVNSLSPLSYLFSP